MAKDKPIGGMSNDTAIGSDNSRALYPKDGLLPDSIVAGQAIVYLGGGVFTAADVQPAPSGGLIGTMQWNVLQKSGNPAPGNMAFLILPQNNNPQNWIFSVTDSNGASVTEFFVNAIPNGAIMEVFQTDNPANFSNWTVTSRSYTGGLAIGVLCALTGSGGDPFPDGANITVQFRQA